jgi:hypothetical protein
MHPAITGLLVGIGVSIALFVLDYMMLRKNAEERAKKAHKTVAEFDQTDKGRMISLFRFLLVLPFVFAFLWWILAKG